MKKIISALLIVLTMTSAACAMPGCPPPPPPPGPGWGPGPHHYFHGDSGWFWGGFGAAVILGTIINSANCESRQSRARREKEEALAKAAEVRNAAKQTASLQSTQLLTQISQSGAVHALENLNNFWKAQGYGTFLDAGEPISTLRVTGFQKDLNIVYTVDTQTGSTSVTVNAPAYDVRESITAQSAAAQKPAVPQKSAAQIAGFSVTEGVRDVEGFLIVQEVAQGSAAAYAGLRHGSVVRKIDGNSTAMTGVEQLWAYIKRRAETNSLITVTFVNNGKTKTVQIRL